MAFERDWEEFFGRLDRGAPLTPDEEKHARAVRALRASASKVPPADPVFLDSLSGALRDEYVRSYGAAPVAVRHLQGVSALVRSFAFGLAACLAVLPAFFLLPNDPVPQPPADSSSSRSESDQKAIDEAFSWSHVGIRYCAPGADCEAAGSSVVLYGRGDALPLPSGSPFDLPFPYSTVALVGFLSLVAAAYAALGALAAAGALWRARFCRASSPRHALGVLAFVFDASALIVALAVAVRGAKSLGAELSFGADFLARTGMAEPAVFAVALAAAALALVTSAASAARNGPRSFPALVATAAAAPWLPAVCIFLLFPSPSSALANGAFLSLSALAMAASVWPFPGAGNRVDRFFAAASVLAVSFPAYAYFLLPRDATKAEIAACCTAVVAWAAATAFSAARRRGFHPAARVLS